MDLLPEDDEYQYCDCPACSNLCRDCGEEWEYCICFEQPVDKGAE